MKKIFVALCAALFCVSCGGIKTPVAGVLYTDVKDGMAVTASAGSSKVGTSQAIGVLCLVAVGDASIQAAAKEAGITRIHHVDYQSKSYLGIYNVYTTIVYGE
ncbi:MAG: TRL-like family protein [Bacteroides cellulosilyticus]|nr:TRL-like family protein [Bacteroides cellulosilyticus]